LDFVVTGVDFGDFEVLGVSALSTLVDTAGVDFSVVTLGVFAFTFLVDKTVVLGVLDIAGVLGVFLAFIFLTLTFTENPLGVFLGVLDSFGVLVFLDSTFFALDFGDFLGVDVSISGLSSFVLVASDFCASLSFSPTFTIGDLISISVLLRLVF